MRALVVFCAVIVSACGGGKSDVDKAFDGVVSAWKKADIEVELKELSSPDLAIAEGQCKEASPGGLSLRLCLYKDAVMADAAQAAGEKAIGTNTGFSLVGDRLLLVVFDPDGVDENGKRMHALSQAFLVATTGKGAGGGEDKESDGLPNLLGK